MSDVQEFDAVVIGTGQGGKPLAGALAGAGWRVAVVERGRVGGTCVVSGCTPSKTMIASARVAHLARRASDYGVRTGTVGVDLAVVRRRKRDIVDAGVESSRKGLERHETLRLLEGEGSFTGPREIRVRGADGERRLRAGHVFIDTGTRPRIPDLPGLEGVPYLDSTTVMELGSVPEHLVVLGGGFIGLELGQMFRRFGAGVTVLEAAPRLAPGEDEDVCEALGEIFREDGIHVRTGARAGAVEATPEGCVRVRIAGAGDAGSGDPPGPADAVEGSHLLVAVGREPDTGALDLEAAGVETDDRGYVRVDERCRTSAEGVWALGDVAGHPPFTHVSYDDFRVIRSQLLGDGRRTTADRLLPYTVFTDPELGRVGLTERQARERGRTVRVARLPMSHVARAREQDETRGTMKAVVDAETDRILGAAVLGVHGGEVVAVVQAAMMGDLPWTALRDGIFSHPTLAESLNNLFMTLDD